ncbi:MAG: hypothetical protein R3E94_07640 [Burkholderiaceae bacterium]
MTHFRGQVTPSRGEVLFEGESLRGLAPMIVEELFLLIGHLAREGIPIVLVEQNVRQAIRLTTRYYLNECGRVVAQGDCSNDVDRAALLSRFSVSDGPAGLGGGDAASNGTTAARASRPSVIAAR